jgi:hypothetical protein
MHGDLYAHNILVDGSQALLGDFGAACVYDGHAALDAQALERIEVRSFGILLKELLALVPAVDQTTYTPALQQLETLAHHCLDTQVSSRPACLRIAEELATRAHLFDRA